MVYNRYTFSQASIGLGELDRRLEDTECLDAAVAVRTHTKPYCRG